MEIAAPQLTRLMRLALIGIATAFAWVVMALLFASLPAHADVPDQDSGVRGAGTSLVGPTDSAASGAVSTVSGGVAEAAGAAVDVAPPPAQPPVSAVAKTAGVVGGAPAGPASDAGSNVPVDGSAQPAVDAVEPVPVVGSIVGAGLEDAASGVDTAADGTLGDLARSVGSPCAPDVPGLPARSNAPDGPRLSSAASAADAVSADAWAAPVAAALRSLTGWFTASAIVHQTSSVGALTPPPAQPPGGPHAVAPGACLPASSPGTGGADAGAWTVAALLPLAAHRAWLRRAGPEDDRVPRAPIGATDVTPD